MSNIKPLPAFVYTRATALVPGVALDQIQIKLVNDIKSELGRCNLSVTKTGNLAVGKLGKTLEANVRESRSATGKIKLESRFGAVGLYRFTLAVESAMKEWSVLRIELPQEFDSFLLRVLSPLITSAPATPPTSTDVSGEAEVDDEELSTADIESV